MATRSEIIAILASGTSYNRFLRPYVIGGIFLSLMLWFGSRYLIPKANAIRSNFQLTYIDKHDPSKNIPLPPLVLRLAITAPIRVRGNTDAGVAVRRYCSTFSVFKPSVPRSSSWRINAASSGVVSLSLR